MGRAIKYLALGDSYTIGTGASAPEHSWPSIIAERLREQTGQEVELTNPAVNGFTTIDLIRHDLPEVRAVKPDLVTILIGVNDLVRDVSPDSYRATLVPIYDELAQEKPPAAHVFPLP